MSYLPAEFGNRLLASHRLTNGWLSLKTIITDHQFAGDDGKEYGGNLKTRPPSHETSSQYSDATVFGVCDTLWHC